VTTVNMSTRNVMGILLSLVPRKEYGTRIFLSVG